MKASNVEVRLWAAMVVLCLLSISLVSCSRDQSPPASRDGGPEPVDSIRTTSAEGVAEFCGACHALPSPQMFDRDHWPAEVQQGYNLYFESGRSDLTVPPIADTIAWYQERAPRELILPGVESVPAVSTFRIEATPLETTAEDRGLPAVSSLVRSAQQPSVLYQTDMRSGRITQRTFSGRRSVSESICQALHPARVEPVDLDENGIEDLLIADLGSFLPADHNLGRVLWARPTSNGDWETIVLLDGLGRIADVRAADLDSDQDLDLLVAEFGWRRSGSILWLEQIQWDEDRPSFEPHRIDERHGAIHVPPADWNGDGHPDFVAAISQEHEAVDLFLNNGRGDFSRTTLYSARDPSYGTSGLQPCDLDGDGDLDVLLTNGDSFDSSSLCPAHSVQWLENRQGETFKRHELTSMPGVHRALPADLDGDGDLDVAASAFLPDSLRSTEQSFDGLIWLEQVSPRQFVRHELLPSTAEFVALEVGDFDGDQRIDVVGGRFAFESSTDRVEPAVILWNESVFPSQFDSDLRSVP